MNENAPHDAPRGRGCRRVLMVGGGIVLLACGGCFYRVFTFLSAGPMDVGTETTVLEGPLLPDGRVDYMTALNDRMSEGVTPENNAAVPLLEAFGPRIIPDAHRWDYLTLLGVPEMPLDGDFVINEMQWMQRDATIDQEGMLALQARFDASCSRPWTGEEFPEGAAWLEANAAPLELIVAATGRPRFFAPFVGMGDPPMINALLLLQQEARAAARLLAARAMLRLGEGDLDGAWDDLMACQRLARLVGQGETLINDLVAVAISSIACAGGQSLAHDDRLTAEQARRFAAQLDTLSPLPEFSGTVDVGERFVMLDAFQSMAMGKGAGVAPGMQPIAGRGFDWNEMMRIANDRYDEYVAAFELETHHARLERLAELDAQLKPGAGMTAPQLIAMALIGSRRQVSRQLADVLLSLLAPAVTQCGVAEARAEAMLRMLRISLLLAARRADLGAYPVSLDELSPDYLAEIPLDPFLDEPFRYERTASGYRLYSVGSDMTDNGGRTYDSDPPGDDIIVETPATEAAAPTDQSGESL